MDIDAANAYEDNLFSLDSEDTAFVQYAQLRENTISQERDYSANLFTPDSESSKSINNFSFATHVSTFKFDFSPGDISEQKHQKLHSTNMSTMVSDFSSHNSENASSTSQSTYGATTASEANNWNIPIASMLNEQETDNLLGHNQKLPKIMDPEISPDRHLDKIMSFNIQNKFDHSVAASMMIDQNITFLALQEPFGCQHKAPKSWQSFVKSELQSARIDCFESQHQVILIDSWKWGGKILSAFDSQLNGRFTSISFKFGDGKALGIISVYASSAETHSGTTTGINTDIINYIDDTMSKWKEQSPDINIVVLGDLQETCSTLNKDNLGDFRKEKCPNGILSFLEDTHISFIRSSIPKSRYLTRFGTAGARGIDHIMLSNQIEKQVDFTEPKILRNLGNTYFPSDHALLSCEYIRNDKNNNEDGIEMDKYNYAKVSRIKLKRSGKDGAILELDDRQFKASRVFKDQEKLYNRIQTSTEKNANLSISRLPEIEARTDTLLRNLWQDGLNQGVEGSKNKLVHIKEDRAIELAHTYRKFKSAINEALENLELNNTKDDLRSAGTTRGRLRHGKGFREFKNLPISTKLRYLRLKAKTKLNLLQKALWWIKDAKMAYEDDRTQMEEQEFWHIRDAIIKTKDLEKQAKTIEHALLEEELERETHMNAVRSHWNKHRKQKSAENNVNTPKLTESSPPKPNTIPHISDSLTSLVNSWLLEAGCTQGFNMSTANTIFENLDKKVLAWKEPLTQFQDPNSFYSDPQMWESVFAVLEEGEKNVQKLLSQILRIQARYKKNTLHYFLSVNTINNFTRKVLQKERAAPATRSIIWDEPTQAYRPCRNEIEELQATQTFHGTWMGDSKSEINCAFASIRKEGRLGPRGITLNPTRKITMKDIPKLVSKGATLSRKIKRAFIKAHNKYTAKLFTAPRKARKEFYYPFYLLDDKGTMNNSKEVEEKLWNSIAGVPCKARHNGFHIAVLGRFGKRWRDLLLKFVKIMLVMRYVPSDIKRIARYPIPKPGKVNEFRPISLCDDLYCFLNGIMTSITSAAIEKIKLLHEGITSYRRGKSCATLVAIEQCFREDCVEGDRPAVQIDEDEEKFFDRVCLEIILAVMKINGFPDTGFIELKACMMGEKLVEIVTSKGIVHAIFQCGLEQGNPDSPTIANLVIKLKHDIWKVVTKKAKKVMNSDEEVNSSCDRYIFNICDKNDIRVFLQMIGYCDDNTKFVTAAKEENLLFFVQYYIQLAGNLSMVTKIGRKSSKCDVQFYNISAKMVLKLRKCWSTAWSFLHDAPIEEEVPFKVFLQPKELENFFELIKFNELPMLEQDRWRNIVQPKAHRHLGLYATLGGDTSMSSTKTLSKMHDRLAQLKIRHMDTPAQRKCTNMLVSSMHSYVPIQSDYNQEELALLDESVASTIMRSNGISSTDCKHRVFLPQNLGGIGFLSVVEIDIIAVAREIEISLNGEGLDSKAMRSRKEAIFSYNSIEENDVNNHVLRAVAKLGRYGILLRDQRDDIINIILHSIAKSNNSFPVGHSQFKGGSGWAVGLGKERFNQLLFGNKFHRMLRYLHHTNWLPSKKSTRLCKQCGVNFKQILETRMKVGICRFEQIDNALSFFEWNNFEDTSFSTQIHKSPNRWNHCRISDLFIVNTKERWEWSQIELLNIAEKQHIIKVGQYVVTDNIRNQRSFSTYCLYGKIFDFLHKRGSPIIIATDGAHQTNEIKSYQWKTSSAFTICSLDIRSHETLEDQQWINRPVIPLLCRSSLIPTFLGETPSDIAHGEMFAVVLEEMAFDPNLPRIIVMDSEAVRNQVQNLRKFSDSGSDRNYIRNLAGGTSKFYSGIIKNKFDSMIEAETLSSHQDLEDTATSWVYTTFRNRNKTFLNIARTWLEENLTETQQPELNYKTSCPKWHAKYFDEHPDRAILKVNSHQLDAFGTTIKRNPRYAQLTPNLALLSANHHADIGADIAIKTLQQHPSMIVRAKTWDNPHLNNLNFVLTYNGKTMDRHVSGSIRKALDDERVKRLKLKPTQGLLWRIMHHMTISWDNLKLHAGLFRSLLGMSNTHTRCLYKSTPYQRGCMLDLLSTIKDKEQVEAIQGLSKQEQILKLTNCSWCKEIQSIPQHGNRRHMLLFCNNLKLTTFRRKINNVIGNRLFVLFQELQELEGWRSVENTLININKIFLSIQKDQTGRLKEISPTRNIQYISMADLLIKNQCPTIKDAYLHTPNTFLPQLFGVTLESTCHTISDENIGVIDGPWLGLIPTLIDVELKRVLQKAGMEMQDKDQRQMWKIKASQSWREIKALILGRAAGIHKIIQAEAQRKETRLVEKYGLEESMAKKSWKCFKRKPTQQQADADRKDAPQMKKRKIAKDPQKQCSGITCGCEQAIWCSASSFQINSISINRKQCQRCTMFNSAMVVAANLFSNIKKSTTTIMKKLINQLLASSTKLRIQYNPIMNMLKNHIPESVYSKRAKSITKKKLTEKWKRIIRIMITVTKMNASKPSAQINLSTSQIIDINEKTILEAIAKKNSEIKEDSTILQEYIAEVQRNKDSRTKGIETTTKANQQINKRIETTTAHIHSVTGQANKPQTTEMKNHQQCNNCNTLRKPKSTLEEIQKNLPSTSSKTQQCTPTIKVCSAKRIINSQKAITIDLVEECDQEINESKGKENVGFSTTEEEEMKCRQRLNVMNRRSWMQGKQLDLAVVALRHEHKNSNIFIAGSGAADIIGQWTRIQGWFNFARIFASHSAAHRKPDGLYIIPIFSGETRGGHWHTLVIEKTGASKRGFVIDSLGTGSVKSEVITNITNAFATTRRGTMEWSAPRSIRQQGCECGPRTVCAIETLCQNQEKGVSIEESIQQVSLVGLINADTYNQMTYRRRVANILDRYTATMQTAIIRRRHGGR